MEEKEDKKCLTRTVTINREDFVDDLSFNALLRQCRGGEGDCDEEHCDSFKIEVLHDCCNPKMKVQG